MIARPARRSVSPWIVAVLAGVVLTSSVARAAERPELAVDIPSGPWTVGDQVPVTLRVTLPRGMREATPRFPQWQERWGEAEVVSADEPVRQTTARDVVTWTQRVTVAAFRPGKIPLPPREVVVSAAESLSLRSATDLHIQVRSVLPADVPREQLRPRDPAPLSTLPLGARFWWTLAAGLALLTAALVAARSRRPAARVAAAASPPDPRYELEAALAALAAEADGLRFHAGLSWAMRRFLGRSVGFPALESTTREVRRRLAGFHLPTETVRAAGELLTECDGVKFARRAPRAARRQLLAAARDLADRVEAHAAHLREATQTRVATEAGREAA